MKRVFLLMAVLALASCASTPKSDVAALQVGLSTVETGATAYVLLPLCGSVAQGQLCSTLEMRQKILQADNAAYLAVKAARQIEDDIGASDSSISAAIASAQTALATLQTIMTGVKYE